MNLRTYAVGPDGRPGVWFYSLDANRRLAVRVARTLFHLPYFLATMRATARRERHRDPAGFVDYASRRRGTADGMTCRFRYRGSGPVRRARSWGRLSFSWWSGTCCSRRGGGALYSGQVYHAPYPVRDAEVAAGDDTLLAVNKMERPGRVADHAMYSSGVRVEVFPLRRIASDE